MTINTTSSTPGFEPTVGDEPVHVYFAIDGPSGKITMHTDIELTTANDVVPWAMLSQGEPVPTARNQMPLKNELAWAILDELWIHQEQQPFLVEASIRGFRVSLTVGVVFSIMVTAQVKIMERLVTALEKVTGRKVEVIDS